MSYKESEVESELQGERGGERVTRRARWRVSELQGKRMELEEYVSVRFAGNGSKRWDEKEIEVPSKTVVRLGRWTAEGLEEAEVHWPGKGKSKGKIWKCVMLPGDSEIPVPPAKRPATEDIISDITTKPNQEIVTESSESMHGIFTTQKKPTKEKVNRNVMLQKSTNVS